MNTDVPNRLSIAHLLLWTAMTALVIAALPRTWENMPAGASEAAKVSNVVFAPCYGAALAGVGIAATRVLARRPGFPTQPGQWLLVHVGLWTLIGGCLLSSVRRLSLSPGDFHLEPPATGLLALFWAALLATSVGAVQATYSWQWRAAMRFHLVAVCLFGLIVLAESVSSGSEAVSLLSALLIAASGAALLAAVLAAVCDLGDSQRFDLFHWVGVVSLLGIFAHPPLTWLIADMAY